MKKKLLFTTLSATLSLSILGACGANDNNLNDNNGVNYSPVRYDRQDDTGVFDRNRGNTNGIAPVRYRPNDNNRGIFNDVNNRNNNNDNGIFDTNHNFNTDLMNNDRGANGIDPGTNGRGNVNAPTGTMNGGTR